MTISCVLVNTEMLLFTFAQTDLLPVYFVLLFPPLKKEINQRYQDQERSVQGTNSTPVSSWFLVFAQASVWHRTVKSRSLFVGAAADIINDMSGFCSRVLYVMPAAIMFTTSGLAQESGYISAC